jgi:ATP-binding cassette subfamily B protein
MIKPTAGRFRVARAALALGWKAAPALLVVQLLLALLSGLIPTAVGLLGEALVDSLTLHGAEVSGVHIAWLAAGVAIGTGLLALLSAVAGLAATAMSRSVKLVAQDRLFRRVNDFKGLRPFEDPETQDSIRLAEQASQDAPQQVLDFSIGLVRNGTTVVGFLGTVLAIWPLMGLLMLACVGVASTGQIWLARRQVASTERSMSALRRQFFYRTLILERRAAMEVRLFGTGEVFHQRLLDSLRQLLDTEVVKSRRDTLMQSALALLTAAVAGVAGVVVAEQVHHGSLTIGEMTLFTAAVAAVQGALASTMAQMGRMHQSLRLFSRYLTLLSAPDDLPDGTSIPRPLCEGITFEGVWFRYSATGPWVLRDLDLQLPHGKAVGLVGVNGAGKSTLIKLLCRYYEPERGRILWDGVDIREFSLQELRRRMGATFQEFMTYDISARDNIGIGELEYLSDLERIRAAARLADIDDVLDGLADGYDTVLSCVILDRNKDKGMLLSGGQWQRVALARALLRDDCDLLILDEPSSGLDPLAERRIHDTLARHRAGRTSLLVSHRLAALRDADVIVVLGEGRIVEQGDHHDLLARGGRYAELFVAQAQGYQMHEPMTQKV